jgi:hypothetical protein
MANFTITLSDTEVKSLEYASVSVQDWIQGAASARALIGQEEIIRKLVAHCNANDIAIATGVEAQVTQAYELDVVDTLANVQLTMEIE